MSTLIGPPERIGLRHRLECCVGDFCRDLPLVWPGLGHGFLSLL
jgi:hypothetical protein